MNASRRHRRLERRRRLALGLVLLTALSLILSLLAALPADAHGEDFSGEVSPADRSVLLTTPGEIHVKVSGGDVDVRLTDASGNEIAFTGEPVREDGMVTLRPPTLESGTYLLIWEDGGEKISSFSIGRETALLDSSGTRRGVGGAGLLGGVALLAAMYALVRAGARANGTRRALLGAGGGVAGGAMAWWLGRPADLQSTLTTAALVAAAGVVALAAVAATRAGTSRWGMFAGAALLALVPIAAGVWRIGLSELLSVQGVLVLLSAVLLLLVAVPVVSLALVRLLAPAQRSDGRERATADDVIGRSGATAPAFTGGRSVLPGLLTGVLALVLLAAAPALVGGKSASVEQARAETESLEECLANQNRLQAEHCLEAAITVVAEESGVNGALERLEQLVRSDSKARYFCHETSHAIGRASLRLNASIGDAFRDGFDVCDFGYYHGIIEGAASGLDDSGFRELAGTVCSDFAASEELFFMQCTHGLGHAAARRTNNDMLRSLDFCDALRDVSGLEGGRLEQALLGCGTGVTMEWFATASASDAAAVLPAVARPRDVCNAVPDVWAESCYEYVGNTVDSSNPVGSLMEISRWCETTTHSAACYRGVARAAGGLGIGDAAAISVCDAAATSDDRNACVRYYIITVATTIDYTVDAVDRVCAQLPAADREGPLSLCVNVREVVEQVLAGSDGKDRSRGV